MPERQEGSKKRAQKRAGLGIMACNVTAWGPSCLEFLRQRAHDVWLVSEHRVGEVAALERQAKQAGYSTIARPAEETAAGSTTGGVAIFGSMTSGRGAP